MLLNEMNITQEVKTLLMLTRTNLMQNITNLKDKVVILKNHN